MIELDRSGTKVFEDDYVICGRCGESFDDCHCLTIDELLEQANIIAAIRMDLIKTGNSADARPH